MSVGLRNGNANLLVLRATAHYSSQFRNNHPMSWGSPCRVLTVACVLCRKLSSHGDVGPQKVVARAFLDP